MRKVLIFTLILIVILGSSCRNGAEHDLVNTKLQSADEGTSVIIFKEYEHNFGKVTEGEKVAYVFTFENRGTGSLVISNATTSCGCTVPKYETKPIPPGKNGNLEVVFNTSGYHGMQTKTIKVKSNASTPVVLLKITAEVVNNSN
ncbi:MAG TPA: DUF1573 domain-containing protein [Bacteroidales bacterium]|nr:DUF1573 domain-containing protein [Bacteroidales bacterium]